MQPENYGEIEISLKDGLETNEAEMLSDGLEADETDNENLKKRTKWIRRQVTTKLLYGQWA